MRRLRTFSSDRRGAAAIEFAFIAPFMLLFYFGLTELCQALLAERRVAHTASAVGDLITQSDETSTTELGDIFKIGSVILAPFPQTSLKMVTTHVTANAQGTPIVDWSRGYGGEAAKPKNGTLTLPPSLTLSPNDSLVVTESKYTYESPFGYFVPDGIVFHEKAYHRPRRSVKVTCATC